jgi:glycosyltransferase involved in cell wall biosynthesis
MPRFSLIVATVGRTKELRRFLSSLIRQEYSDYEVIVVDQNRDDRVVTLLTEFEGQIVYTLVRCSPGVSKARNLGYSLAEGDLVAFPDDDCWYSQGLLKNVDEWFQRNVQYSIFAVGAVDETGARSGNRWIQNSCDLHPINVFRTTFCSTLFIRNNTEVKKAYFDEGIGPGASTKFACGDETDFILQLLGMGLRGRFDRAWHVGHARRDMLSSSISYHRAITYGCGMGRVLRKHALFSVWAGLFVYDVARILVVTFSGRLTAATLCAAHTRGLLDGYFSGLPPDIQLNQEVNP